MTFKLQPITTGGLIRLALYGESFTGKSHSAVAIARALFPDEQIAIIDTEGKASAFAGLPNLLAGHLTTYTPDAYLEAIREVEKSAAKVMIIDGLSDMWDKRGGLLSISKATKNGRNDSSTRQGWGRASAKEKEIHEAIQNSAKHVFVTMRGRASVDDKTGKKKPPEFIQRDDVSFIFDTMGWLDTDHRLHITKAYAPGLLNATFPLPRENVADLLRAHYLTGNAPRWVDNDEFKAAFYKFAYDNYEFDQGDALEALCRTDEAVQMIEDYTGSRDDAKQALEDYNNYLAAEYTQQPAQQEIPGIPADRIETSYGR